ncbi:MAG: HAD-IIB family hydrolase [Deltaproteobacteria bacterium]|nr:HAD-IIB family hydrolase [Deltaproteobacteria bacterium]MBW2074293.1 HAD-IIB family hydrolase [Deltaproteobacteria bacterium]RLB82885.1 MAG: mannosyl-3-phosphoglycerate phosphatase [Deltaproteobacteria bacterium]
MEQILIFTDLDGTLIDHDTYDFEAARPALDQIRSRSIPVIICSSKTRAEIEVYRQRMGLSDPFIVENGGAVFIPAHALNLTGVNFVERGGYHVVELGLAYAELCATWKKIKTKGNFRMKGFCEMTVEEIAILSGLPPEEARWAASREYSEPFTFSDAPERLALLRRLLQEKGLTVTRGGRFYHVTGKHDKGKAVQILTKAYARTYPESRLCSVGLGDSANDIPMLRNVDKPILIRKKTGGCERIPGIKPFLCSEQPGPRGWAEAIQKIL